MYTTTGVYKTHQTYTDMATLTMHEDLVEDHTLDHAGRVVKITPGTAPNFYTMFLVIDRDGRARVGDITDQRPEPSIPLS